MQLVPFESGIEEAVTGKDMEKVQEALELLIQWLLDRLY